MIMNIETVAVRVLTDVINKSVTEEDIKDWAQHGHLIMAWLRNEIIGNDELNIKYRRKR